MDKSSKIFIAGHRGLVGSAILRKLTSLGYFNIIYRTRNKLDLTDQIAVNQFFKEEKIDYVFMVAAKVGGILFNQQYQVEFLYENLMIAMNTIRAAADYGVTKFLFLGSSCIYPKFSPQPIKENYLLSGGLEPTNEGYALAKICGLKLCEKYNKQFGKRFISAMPCNLYGPNDNFHPDHSHVIPGLLRRFHEAKRINSPEVIIWGTGKARREFLYIDDLADALVTVMLRYEDKETINIGTGEDIAIIDLALLIKDVIGYKGEIIYDFSKPDGTPRKVLDISKSQTLGWEAKTSLQSGLKKTYTWILEQGIFDKEKKLKA